jgi:transcription antitermination protein NusB
VGAQRSGREAGLQLLFQCEVSNTEPGRAAELFFRHFEADAEGQHYARALLTGTLRECATIDDIIRQASANWRLERMSRVDRNLLRMATYELMHAPDVPRAVILDEAIELAKSFGTEESPSFVNGVLNRIADLVNKPAA